MNYFILQMYNNFFYYNFFNNSIFITNLEKCNEIKTIWLLFLLLLLLLFLQK